MITHIYALFILVGMLDASLIDAKGVSPHDEEHGDKPALRREGQSPIMMSLKSSGKLRRINDWTYRDKSNQLLEGSDGVWAYTNVGPQNVAKTRTRRTSAVIWG
jgi:hypothetical protein